MRTVPSIRRPAAQASPSRRSSLRKTSVLAVAGLTAVLLLLAAAQAAVAAEPQLELRLEPSAEPRNATEDLLDCDDVIQGDACLIVRCQNCSAPIPDGSFVSQTFEITPDILEGIGLRNCVIRDLNAAVDLTHPEVGQLQTFLFRPGGPTVPIYDPPLTCTGGGVEAVFDDESSRPPNACPAVGISLQPFFPLLAFDGRPLEGTWGLDVVDGASGGTGTFEQWGFAADVECNTMEPSSCEPGPATLCLNEGRFQVTADWRTPTGATGAGQGVQLTPDTGYFWFFDSSNVELVVKVLDACGDPFNRYWVFAGGLTNVEVILRVVDTETGEENTYLNPLRTPFQPIQDTNAFATCP